MADQRLALDCIRGSRSNARKGTRLGLHTMSCPSSENDLYDDDNEEPGPREFRKWNPDYE